MAQSIVNRYGLTVEIPAEVEAAGVEAVEEWVHAALDAACQKEFRVPLAQLDAEAIAAVRAVPATSDEEAAADPEGAGQAREAAVKAAVGETVDRARTRAASLPPLSAPVAAEFDDEENRP